MEQTNSKKKRKIDWAAFITSEESQREMARAEQEMAKSSCSIFTSEEFLTFLEKYFNVSFLKIHYLKYILNLGGR